jgi:hypothetical protein
LAPKNNSLGFPSAPCCGMMILTKVVSSVYSGVNLALLIPNKYWIPPIVFLIPSGSIDNFLGSNTSVKLPLPSILRQVAIAVFKSSPVSVETGKFFLK